jgi:hypothetical protein
MSRSWETGFEEEPLEELSVEVLLVVVDEAFPEEIFEGTVDERLSEEGVPEEVFDEEAVEEIFEEVPE